MWWTPPDPNDTIPVISVGGEYVSPDGQNKGRVVAVDGSTGMLEIVWNDDVARGHAFSHVFAGWTRVERHDEWASQRKWAAENGWVWKDS